MRDPQRAEVDADQPAARGVRHPGGFAGERDVHRRAADPDLAAELAPARVDDRDRAGRRVDRHDAARVGGERDRPFAGVDLARRAVGFERVDTAIGGARDPQRAGRERDVADVRARAERRERVGPATAALGGAGGGTSTGTTRPVAASVTHSPFAPAAIRAGAPPTRTGAPTWPSASRA